MKIVINVSDCAFSVSPTVAECLGVDEFEDSKEFRTNPELIEFLERCGTEFTSGDLAKLEVREVPDQTTDWRVVTGERGSESLFYVVDGKLYG